MKEREIMLKVEKMLADMGYHVVYVGLYGSNNYSMTHAGSDYDYKALVVPKLDDIIFNRKPVSTTIPHEWNGQVDVKDVRLMIDQWKKGASNFMELLFTEWYDIPDPLFKSYFEELRARREEIAYANPKSTLKAMYGMMMEKFHALDHPYPCQAEEIEGFGYASKQACHLVRIGSMALHYGELPYETLLNPFNGIGESVESIQNDFLYAMNIKVHNCEFEDIDAAKEEGQHWLDMVKPIVDNAPTEFNAEVYDFLDKIKGNVLRTAFKAELKED